jgi:hypothetical protein
MKLALGLPHVWRIASIHGNVEDPDLDNLLCGLTSAGAVGADPATSAAAQRWPLDLCAITMIHLDRIGLLVTAAVIGVACQHQAAGTPRLALPSVLVVPPGATDVRPEAKPTGEIGVMYFVEEEFDADALLGRIRAALPSPAWQPLPNDWLNPSLVSSHTRGWTDFDDATRAPATHVHQWLAQWQDSNGNVVWYALRYDSRLKSGAADLSRPDNSRLSVTAVWVPERIATQIVSSAGRRGR